MILGGGIVFYQVEADAAGLPVYTGESAVQTGNPRVVVLGSGWGAVSFVKSLSKADWYALPIEWQIATGTASLF